MRIFAVADLHLSGQPPQKPMDVFGPQWHDHWSKIATYWQAHVTPEDAVLLAGDISWAMKLADALPDLEAIAALPGKKIMVRGNHDYWWQTVTKMTRAINGRITFLHNTFAPLGDVAVCGSRGWVTPEDPSFTAADQPIFTRELARVEASLAAAWQAGYRQIILMLHYPPVFNSAGGGFAPLLAKYHVAMCVFGHLHGAAAQAAPNGNINGTACHLVACDALQFTLKQLV